MYLFYESNCYWEIDYITKTLLKDINFNIKFFDTQEIRNINIFLNLLNNIDCNIDSNRLDKKDNIINNNIFVFGSNSEYPSDNLEDYKIYPIIELIKPRIIIHLSDEWGNKPALNELGRNSNLLLLRQYSHPNYSNISNGNNILQIPLGYMHDMFENDFEKIQIKKSSEREIKWSFIGNIKQDRLEMINEFACLTPNIVKKGEPVEMREIYRNSVFVPNGRGNKSLDCFRIYEAVLCGAIPIIVSENNQEFKETFSGMDNPPFLYCNSWKEALGVCKFLFSNPDILNKEQEKLLNWWTNYILKLRNIIKNNLLI